MVVEEFEIYKKENKIKAEIFTPEPQTKDGEETVKEKSKELKTNNLLLCMSGDNFDMFGNNDIEPDFASSLSSSASQQDFDNMAMEAWEEIDNLRDEKSKQPRPHDYSTPGSNWADDYNKGLPSKI
eukprot:CAMPEP_0205817350 /NCGR_PEP_ID=MMETSP0205-20121125/24158_1 /ASSEMBLY_ACC=CAM_ASM_000278 /TAXON_ID=36767 /ORGANISM="Euplotes focardii, Strain TN1" /LENGTH=125 /DNA_ID=CAMNT_0053107649 /DNA_START=158 /DNA_END=532 /DNA_ORIENTATION=+